MTGAELGNRWQLHLKAWQRMKESALEDDNPHIQDYIGRGEVKLGWNVNEQNYLGLTARGSLGQGKGSGASSGCAPWAKAGTAARAICACMFSCSAAMATA
jgi:hypothetical protein